MGLKDMPRCPVFGAFLILLLLYFFMLLGCAINPATKGREFMIVSEEKEFNIGQDVDRQVREEMGVYLELPELRSYVKKMGDSIGRQSDRPGLIYRIEIIDSPDFNAFALPGGFMYIHRGLLERVNSADELASVFGHEIAHVAARHSAAQISKAQLLNLGLFAVVVATEGAVQDYGQLINLGAAMAFNKFSRDDEREADHFGTKYMLKAGYNPKASVDLMKQLKKLHEREPSSLEVWFMTHPPTSERIENLNYEINEIRQNQPEALNRPIKRNEFITLLDGLAVGEWNGNELVKGDRYYNKEYLLSLVIPDEWVSHINSKQYTSIFAHLKKEFMVYFNIEPLRTSMSTADYFKDFETHLRKLNLKKIKDFENPQRLAHGAQAGVFTGDDGRMGAVMAEGVAFVRDTNGFNLIALCKKNDFKEFQPIVESMANSISFISQKESSSLEPPRLKIHKVKPGETWESITKKYFTSTKGMTKLAEYNGLEASQELLAGALLKIPPSLRIQ